MSTATTSIHGPAFLFVAFGMPSELSERVLSSKILVLPSEARGNERFYIHKNPRLRVNVNRSQGEGDVSLDSERLFAVCVARVTNAGMLQMPALIFE